MGLAVDGGDMKLVRATVDMLRPAPSPEQAQGLCLDKGYDFVPHGPHPQPWGRGSGSRRLASRRWVVERTHYWMNRYRILVRWDKSPANYIGLCPEPPGY